MNIKELAEQAGLNWRFSPAYEECLEHFAELIRTDEREACAKLLENTDLTNTGQHIGLVSGIILGYVKAIRQRGEK